MDSKATNVAQQKPGGDGTQAAGMRLRRLTLFSSGVGFFEHAGEVDGDAELTLPINKDAVNDALKSIVVNDPGASPTVSYHSEDTLLRTMKGLSIDLHGNTHVAGLLNSLKGAEIEVLVPKPLKGRIFLVEHRHAPDKVAGVDAIDEREAYLSLSTSGGIRIISLKEISGFRFCDAKIQEDADRALDLIMQARDSGARNLAIKLPGQKPRRVSISYVIPTPIWKASYRLDLSREDPFLQGWAIVDNDSDTDWEQVELALVTGRPVSFIQNLYAPYQVSRPTLPLAIAGIAEASLYDSGTPRMEQMNRAPRGVAAAAMSASAMRGGAAGGAFGKSKAEPMLMSVQSLDDMGIPMAAAGMAMGQAEAPDAFAMAEGIVETAHGRAAGDQFEFTIKSPVSLARQQSAMLPLVEGAVHAEKMLVFPGSKAASGKPMNPAIGAELTNDTGMKLPAGPITVYDGGTYAGDALIAFFPIGEKRIISYGEDLSVTGSFTASSNRIFSAVSINGGVAVIKQKRADERAFTFRNASNETKRLIVEHPIRPRPAKLVAPAAYMEKTSSLYRFELQLPPGELDFIIKEEEPLINRIVLTNLSHDQLINYSNNQEFPESVRAGLRRAIGLIQDIAKIREKLAELQNQLARLLSEQERTRKNLEAAGPKTQQGQNYLSRLAAQDTGIDEAHKEISAAEQSAKDAQRAYDEYIQDMCFEEGNG